MDGKQLTFVAPINYTPPLRDNITFLPAVEIEVAVAQFIATLAASIEKRADFRSILKLESIISADLFTRLRVLRTVNVTDLLGSLVADRIINIADAITGLSATQEAVADIFIDLSRAEEVAADILSALIGLQEANADTVVNPSTYQEKHTADSMAQLKAGTETRIVDTLTDLARYVQQSTDVVEGLTVKEEAGADILTGLVAERIQNTVDVLAGFPAWQEHNSSDLTTLLSEAIEAVQDLKAVLRIQKEWNTDLYARISVAQLAANDLLASLRVLQEKRIADIIADFAQSIDAISDMIAELANGILSSTDIYAPIAHDKQIETDLVSFLRVLQQVDADLITYMLFLQQGSVADILAVMRLAYEMGAADILATAKILSELLVTADLMGNLVVQNEKGADLRTYLYALQEEAAKTDAIAQLPLLRPRWLSISPVGGSRRDIRLRTAIDPITGEPRMGPWNGKELELRSQTTWEGEEPDWGMDTRIELLLDPKWWWKHGRAHVRAALRWRIYDIAKGDVSTELSQRRVYRQRSNIQTILSRWYGATQVDRLENTDEDWNTGALVHLLSEDGSLQIPPAGNGKGLTFYADNQTLPSLRENINISPYTFGIRISPPLDVSIIRDVRMTSLSWNAITPAQTGILIEVALTDGSPPSVWTAVQNGKMIPVTPSGMDLTGKVLWIRQKLWSQGRGKTPKLNWLFVSLTSTGGSASDIRTALGKYVPKAEQIRAKIEILKRDGDRSLLRRLTITEVLLRAVESGILTRDELIELLAREWEV